MRAAASSMAKGRPSRCLHSSMSSSCGFGAGREERLHGSRPLDEQFRRLLEVERSERDLVLAWDADAHPAGGDETQAGTGGQQCHGARRGRRGDVLAAVQDDDDVPSSEAVDGPLFRCQRRLPAERCSLERADPDRDGVSHAGRGDRCQFDEPHLVAVEQAPSDQLENETGLADSAGSDHGRQP